MPVLLFGNVLAHMVPSTEHERAAAVAEYPCTFSNDTALFNPEPSTAAAVLAVLPNILSHKACCAACTGDWADRGRRACRAFTWDAFDMVSLQGHESMVVRTTSTAGASVVAKHRSLCSQTAGMQVCTLFRKEPDETLDKIHRGGFISGQLAGAHRDPVRSLRPMLRGLHKGQLMQVPEKWSATMLLEVHT